MLESISVTIDKMPEDYTSLYSVLSALGGAVIGSLIMYFSQKKIQKNEQKIRLSEKKIEVYGELIRIYRSHRFFREENFKWVFDDQKFNKVLLPELEKNYLYLPVKTQVSLDLLKDFETRYLHDGIPDTTSEELYREKLKLVYDSVHKISDEYKEFIKVIHTLL